MRVLVGISLFASILLLGTSGMVQQSYGLTDQTPSYRGDDCAVTWDFTNPGTRENPTPGTMTHGGTCSAGELNDDPTINEFFCEGSVNNVEVGSQGITGFTCHAEVPNFDDPFNTKLIRFQVWWSGTAAPFLSEPIKFAPTFDACTFVERVVLSPDSPGHYYEDWICHPNPDNERLWFSLVDTNTRIDLLTVDSISFEEPPVGGIFKA